MSVEVKVSYESPQELQEVLERLEPILFIMQGFKDAERAV